MKDLVLMVCAFAMITVASCTKDNNNKPSHCTNGVKDGDETAIDCGGSCSACALPTACFTADDSVFANLPIQFTNCSQQAISYNWNFGDGGTSTDASPSHTYATNGNYTVTLTVTNTAGSNTTTRTVTAFSYTNADYAGSFIGPELCTVNGTTPTYTAQVVANGTYGITINNFGNLGINVTATLLGNDFTIPSQTHASILVNGVGTLNNNKQNLNYSYSYNDGVNAENCVATLTRQ